MSITECFIKKTVSMFAIPIYAIVQYLQNNFYSESWLICNVKELSFFSRQKFLKIKQNLKSTITFMSVFDGTSVLQLRRQK